MNDTPATTPLASAPQSRRRWHWSTWVVAGVVLLLGTLLNCGGDLWADPEHSEIRHGWPWTFLTREYHVVGHRLAQRGVHKYSFWFNLSRNITAVYGEALIANVVAIGCAVGFTTYLWQRRFRDYWYHYSLLDVAVVTFSLCAALAYWRNGNHDAVIEEKLIHELRNCDIDLHDTSHRPLKIGEAIAGWRDYPHDWFWEIFHIPENQRPHACLGLFLGMEDSKYSKSAPKAKFSPHAIALLKQLSNLRILEFDTTWLHFDTTTPLAAGLFIELRELSHLRFIGIDCNQVDDDIIELLTLLPCKQRLRGRFRTNYTGKKEIHRLKFLNTLIADCDEPTKNMYQEFALLPNVKTFFLDERAGWPHFCQPIRVPQHCELAVIRSSNTPAAIDFAGCKSLRQLYVEAPTISPETWRSLAQCGTLEELQISCTNFRDEDFKQLVPLTNLRRLVVLGSRQSSNAFPFLNQFASLEEVSLADIGDLKPAKARYRLIVGREALKRRPSPPGSIFAED